MRITFIGNKSIKNLYNIARVLALYKSYWAAMNKIFIQDFFHDDVFICVFRLFS